MPCFQAELGLSPVLSLRKQGWARCLTRPANSTKLRELPRGGGIIRRGVAALEPASSSSGYDSQLPRSFLPLTEDWDLPLVDEWALVTDDEEDENINNDDDEPGP